MDAAQGSAAGSAATPDDTEFRRHVDAAKQRVAGTLAGPHGYDLAVLIPALMEVVLGMLISTARQDKELAVLMAAGLIPMVDYILQQVEHGDRPVAH